MRNISMLAMGNFKAVKMRRTNPEPLGNILKLFVAANGLGYSLFNQAVFQLWDSLSGAGIYSANRFYRKGVLHVTIHSSLVRSRLMMDLDNLKDRINEALENNPTVQLSGIKEKVERIILH